MDDVDIDDVDDKVVLTVAIADDDFESVAIVVVVNDVGETEFLVLGFNKLSIFLNIVSFATE